MTEDTVHASTVNKLMLHARLLEREREEARFVARHLRATFEILAASQMTHLNEVGRTIIRDTCRAFDAMPWSKE